MRIAAVQLAYDDAETVEDRRERVAALVADQRGADLVVLPELWAPGGFSYRTWAERAEPVDGPTVEGLAAAARVAGCAVHVGSVVERAGGHLWNTSVLLDREGAVTATYRKIHRFGFGEGEPRLMEAGTDVVVADVPVRAAQPDGATVRLGLSTCYDLRFPELYRAQLDLGAELLVVPAAWPAARVAHWTLLGRARAVEDQCLLVAVNTAGTHAGHAMGGRSQVVSPSGDVLAEAGPDQEVLVVEVDPGSVARARAAFPVLGDRRLVAGSPSAVAPTLEA